MVHFVGAGPGAPDLITVRGKQYLEEADVVIYAGSLVNPKLLEYTKDICTIYNSAKMTLEEVIHVIEKAEAEGKKVGIICTEESQDMYQGGNLEVIGSREHEETVAHNLFAVLRDFDARKVDCIFSESFSKDQLGQAIMNRLCKAAGYHIVNI